MSEQDYKTLEVLYNKAKYDYDNYKSDANLERLLEIESELSFYATHKEKIIS